MTNTNWKEQFTKDRKEYEWKANTIAYNDSKVFLEYLDRKYGAKLDAVFTHKEGEIYTARWLEDSNDPSSFLVVDVSMRELEDFGSLENVPNVALMFSADKICELWKKEVEELKFELNKKKDIIRHLKSMMNSYLEKDRMEVVINEYDVSIVFKG